MNVFWLLKCFLWRQLKPKFIPINFVLIAKVIKTYFENQNGMSFILTVFENQETNFWARIKRVKVIDFSLCAWDFDESLILGCFILEALWQRKTACTKIKAEPRNVLKKATWSWLSRSSSFCVSNLCFAGSKSAIVPTISRRYFLPWNLKRKPLLISTSRSNLKDFTSEDGS